MNTQEQVQREYKDPQDLRSIPIERLDLESNKGGLQFRQWHDLFSIECAIRLADKFSESDKWSILSQRYLLMEREHLTDFKLFTKDEVLRMIRDAYYKGFSAHEYLHEEETDDKHKLCDAYVEKQNQYL